jgi:hypothetical protein
MQLIKAFIHSSMHACTARAAQAAGHLSNLSSNIASNLRNPSNMRGMHARRALPSGRRARAVAEGYCDYLRMRKRQTRARGGSRESHFTEIAQSHITEITEITCG